MTSCSTEVTTSTFAREFDASSRVWKNLASNGTRCERKSKKIREQKSQKKLLCYISFTSFNSRVVTTLDFCMTALEQLRSWAVFAIFPTDESQREKYVSFVEQRYACVIEPLRQFVDVLHDSEVKVGHVTSTTLSRDSRRSSPVTSVATGLPPDISIQRGNRFKNSLESPRLGYPQKVSVLQNSYDGNGVDIHDMETAQEYEIHQKHERDATQESSSPLRDEIHEISRRYSEEGTEIRNCVFEQLQQCKEHREILFKWGQASLSSLGEILDEALADELYFMVRSKTTRILSTISIFEETADKIEKQLSIHFVSNPHSGSASERGTASTAVTSPVVTSESNVSSDKRGRRSATHSHKRTKSESLNGNATVGYDKKSPDPKPSSEPNFSKSLTSSNHMTHRQRLRERHYADVTAKSQQNNRCLNKVAQPQQVPYKPYRKYPGYDNFEASKQNTSTGTGEIIPLSTADGASERLEFDMYDLDLRIDIPQRESPTGSEGNELEELLLSWSMNSGSGGAPTHESGSPGKMHKSNGFTAAAAAGGKAGKSTTAAAAGSRKTQQQQQQLRNSPLHCESKFMPMTSPDSNADRHSDVSSCTPRSNSTPEPPLSPRPRALVKHPKIMKDKLHSMALPSKFPGVGSNRFSASW